MIEDRQADADALDRRVAHLKRALLWIWLGWLICFVAIIVFLNVVALPSRLPPWFIVFVFVAVAPAVATVVLRVRIADLQITAAQAQLTQLNRTLDDIS